MPVVSSLLYGSLSEQISLPRIQLNSRYTLEILAATSAFVIPDKRIFALARSCRVAFPEMLRAAIRAFQRVSYDHFHHSISSETASESFRAISPPSAVEFG